MLNGVYSQVTCYSLNTHMGTGDNILRFLRHSPQYYLVLLSAPVSLLWVLDQTLSIKQEAGPRIRATIRHDNTVNSL